MSALRVVALALAVALLSQGALAAAGISITSDIPSPQCYNIGNAYSWQYSFTDSNGAVTVTWSFLVAGVAQCTSTVPNTTPFTVNCAGSIVVGNDGQSLQAKVTDTNPTTQVGVSQNIHVISIASVTATGSIGSAPTYYAVLDAAASSISLLVSGTFTQALFADSSTSHGGPTTVVNTNSATYNPGGYVVGDNGATVTVTVSNSACAAFPATNVVATVNIVYLTVGGLTTANPTLGTGNVLVLKAGANTPTFTVGAGTGYTQFTLTETGGSAFSHTTTGCTAASGCSYGPVPAGTFAVADDGKTVAATVTFANGGPPSTTVLGALNSLTIAYLTSPNPFASIPPFVLCGGAGPTCTAIVNYIVVAGVPAGTAQTVTLTFQGTGFDTASATVGATPYSNTGSPATGIAVNLNVASGDNAAVVTPSLYNSASPTITIGSTPASVTLIYLRITSFAPSAPWAITNLNFIVVKGANPASASIGFTFAGTGFDKAQVSGPAPFNGAATTGASGAVTIVPLSATAGNNGNTLTPSAWFSSTPATKVFTSPLTFTLIYLSITSLATANPVSHTCAGLPCTAGTIYTVYSAATTQSVQPVLTGTGFDTATYVVTGAAGGLTGNYIKTPVTSPATSTIGNIVAADSGKTLTVTITNAASGSAVSETLVSGTNTAASLTLIYLSTPNLPTLNADNSQNIGSVPTQIVVATYGFAGGNTNYLNPAITIIGTGFDSAQLINVVGGAQVPFSTCGAVSTPGTTTAQVTCYPHGMGTALSYADDTQLWAIKLWHSSFPPASGGPFVQSNSIRMVVFGVHVAPSGQPANELLFATGLNQGSATFSVTTQGGAGDLVYTPAAIALSWFQRHYPTSNSFNVISVPSAQTATSIVVTSDGITPGVVAPNGQVVGQHQDAFYVTLTLNNVVVTSNTVSLQLMIGSYPNTLGTFSANPYASTTSQDFTYDYYAPGAVWLPTINEPTYTQAFQVTNVYALDNQGNVVPGTFPSTCSLVLLNGANAAPGGATVPTTSVVAFAGNAVAGPSGTGVVTGTFTIASTASDPPLATPFTAYDYVVQLNGGYLQVQCTPVAGFVQAVLGRSQNPPVLNIRFPPKVSPELPGLPSFTPIGRYPFSPPVGNIYRWGANPPFFGTSGYSNFPEPGHWDYTTPQTVQLQFVHDGNPSVLGVANIFTYNIQSGPSSGTTTVTFTAATASSSNGAVIVPWTITIYTPATDNLLTTINNARTLYFQHFLSIVTSFPALTVGPQLTGFTMLWQPQCEANTCASPSGYPPGDIIVDTGVLLPHFPPVMNDYKLEPLTLQQNNYPDVGKLAWFQPSLEYVQFVGFPKHDSPFGNPQYATMAKSSYPTRNYDQILEARLTQNFVGTYPSRQGSYAASYSYFTSVAANTVLTGITNPASGTTADTTASSGVFVATSNIGATPPQSLYTYNKWEYRWVLGVYRVAGVYEPYTAAGAGGLTPNVDGVVSMTNYPYLYHTIGGGWLGVWNWYPREFTPALCPAVTGPFAIGTSTAVVAGPTTGSMYPAPSSGVLSWAYSHNTAGGSFRLDAALASSTLVGTGSTQLLPTYTGSTHLFSSSFNIVTQTVSPVAFAAGTGYPQTPDPVGHTVVAQGTISSILGSDANSVIAAQYTHTLPSLPTATTFGQKTITAFPTVVEVNNCNAPVTLSTMAMTTTTVTHRAGETFVIRFPAQPSSATVNVLAQDPSSAAPPTTVLSITTSTTVPVVARFTAGYTTAGVPLTSTKFSLNAGVTVAPTLFVYEQSNLPANWPFTSAIGGILAPQPNAANLAIASQCTTPALTATNAQSPGVVNVVAPAASSQWIGCGTSGPFVQPCCTATTICP